MFNAYLHGAKIASGETELEALKAAIVAYELRFKPPTEEIWASRMGRGELIATLDIREETSVSE